MSQAGHPANFGQSNRDDLLATLDERGTVRFEELVEEDTLRVRQTLDELALEEEIKRFPLGDHIMVKRL